MENEEIKQFASAIKKPPYNLTPELLWQAYEHLEKSKVSGAGAKNLLTDIISLVRFAIRESDFLEPFSETVNSRFSKWLEEQEIAEAKFTAEEIEWLKMIKDHIATSLNIEVDDFEFAQFYEKGGPMKVYKLFGEKLDCILEELNERLEV